MWFPQVGRFCGFPAGNKGVFRTTGDRGWIFLGGLWIPYGYPKISDPLQNRRLLPLKVFLSYTSNLDGEEKKNPLKMVLDSRHLLKVGLRV